MPMIDTDLSEFLQRMLLHLFPKKGSFRTFLLSFFYVKISYSIRIWFNNTWHVEITMRFICVQFKNNCGLAKRAHVFRRD